LSGPERAEPLPGTKPWGAAMDVTALQSSARRALDRISSDDGDPRQRIIGLFASLGLLNVGAWVAAAILLARHPLLMGIAFLAPTFEPGELRRVYRLHRHDELEVRGEEIRQKV
jgi:hypothetical protein